MINCLVNSLSKYLKDKYNVYIYVDDIPQDFKQPCFYVGVLQTAKTELVGDRYILNIPIDIQYFNDENLEKKREMRQIADELFNDLRFLTLVDYGGLIQGYNCHFDIIDNVLHFYIDYKLIINNRIKLDNEFKEIKLGVKYGN